MLLIKGVRGFHSFFPYNLCGMAIKAWKSMHICDSMEESPSIARIELLHL